MVHQVQLPIRPPVIVHHMAALDGRHPPNSLEAITACLEGGAAFVEVDITALADGDYLLVHEPQLAEETTGRGPVSALSSADAANLKIRWNGQPTSCVVPRLSQVVARFQAYPGRSRLQLDLKNVIPFGTDEPLERLVSLIRPLGERVVVSTNADWQLRRLRALAPWLDLGLDIHFYLEWRGNRQPSNPAAYPRQRGAYGYWDDHPLAQTRHWPTAAYLSDRCGMLAGLVPGLSTFYISHSLLVQSLDDGFNWANALHQRQIKLDAWTLDTTNPRAVAHAKRLYEAGVDQYTTNTPRELAQRLEQWADTTVTRPT
jgi:glycerophosphoryl diester phosphodiesterase